jgi:cell division protein FtsB
MDEDLQRYSTGTNTRIAELKKENDALRAEMDALNAKLDALIASLNNG